MLIAINELCPLVFFGFVADHHKTHTVQFNQYKIQSV